MREHDTLRFDLTDDDLTFAIDTLKDRHPELICHRAWQIITNEQERRRVAKWFTKFHIDISVSAYAELPAEVRARFDARKRPPLAMPK